MSATSSIDNPPRGLADNGRQARSGSAKMFLATTKLLIAEFTA
jgi:hypothetical protein